MKQTNTMFSRTSNGNAMVYAGL